MPGKRPASAQGGGLLKRPSGIRADVPSSALHSFLISFADEWNLQGAQIEAALQRIKHDRAKFPEDQEAAELRLFLYAKGILSSLGSKARVSYYDDIIAGRQAEPLERLRRIVLKDELGSPIKKEQNTFTKFISRNSAWADSFAYVAFRDDPRLRHSGLVERVQHSGLGYMHAPVVLQEYLVSLHTGSGANMLDLAKFIRRHCAADELEQHILRDEGSSSQAFLESILEDKSGLVTIDASLLADADVGPLFRERVVSHLKEHGPALVSMFRVFGSLMNLSAMVHVGNDPSDTECTGLHAMVLVGHRRTSTEDDRFLIQNWWKSKEFLEVDVAYLVKCKPRLVFVTSKQTKVPGTFATNSSRHVELEMTIAERQPPEM